MQDPTPPLVVLGKRSWHRFVRELDRAARSTTFGRIYGFGCVAVLFATTLVWAILGADVQSHNADQLSDPYLFSSSATFHAATFPGSHTFLLKWPIFWLVNVFGVSSTSLLVATVAVVVATLATLVYILYRIDRRPLVLGTICLSLSLALLLIPTQPYAGGILPVNMAMLTTRNLEYAVYLGVLVLLARAKRFRSWSFALAVVLLAILVASDKLFLSLSGLGALCALFVYALFSNWELTTYAVRWLVGSIAAAAGAMVLLLGISTLHITHLTNSTAATPYGTIHSAQDLLLGVVYAVLGVFTNAGANPAYDNKVLRELPGDIAHHMWSLSAPAYLIALGGLLFALIAVWYVLRPTLKAAPRGSNVPTANRLALSLLWSTVAALGVFVATAHYYAVDARYLAISLFALVVIVAVWLRTMEWQWPEDLLMVACTLLVAIVLAVPMAFHAAGQQTAALQPIDARNQLVAAALKHHKVDTLVGDYWRVLPIKLADGEGVTVTPLAGCTRVATALTSGEWQPDLANHSFAYLVTLDGGLTNFPNCTLAQITAKYGLPNATQIISGTLAKPNEALLFYDQGARPPIKPSIQAIRTPLAPVGLEQLADVTCKRPTIMNVVAHEDDDLLFLSPDLLHNIQSGDCVRTVFLTAGDGGHSKFYWLSRQLGSEAAYSSMLNIKPVWDQQNVELAPGEYATVATPRGNTQVSLIFLNLPDGNLQGQGFTSSGQESLSKLYNGTIPDLHTVDDQSNYTSDQLVTALSMLMNVYQPASIHTQADVPSGQYPDHSDHITTGLYAQAAAAQYNQEHFGGTLAIPVLRYIGYPIHGRPANVSGDELEQKETAFFAYGLYDGGVCRSIADCTRDTAYGSYLPRQYQE